MPATRFIVVILLLLNLLAFAAIQGWLGGSVPRGEPERLSNQLNPQAIVIGPTAPDQSASTTPPPVPAAPQAPPQPEDGTEGRTPPAPPAEAASEPKPKPEAKPEPKPEAKPEPKPDPKPEPKPEPAKPQMACLRFSNLNEDNAGRLAALGRDLGPQARVNRSSSGGSGKWWVHLPADGRPAEGRIAELRLAGVNDMFLVRDEGPLRNAISLGVFGSEESANRALAEFRKRGLKDLRISQRTPATFTIEIRAERAALDGASARLRNVAGNPGQACKP